MNVFNVFQDDSEQESTDLPSSRLRELIEKRKRDVGDETLLNKKLKNAGNIEKSENGIENTDCDMENANANGELSEQAELKLGEVCELNTNEDWTESEGHTKGLDSSLLNRAKLRSPQIKIHVVEALELCLHEVALPPDIDYRPLQRPKKLLKEYKFLLDPFQKEAIMCIENDESVLVSAHTSSGKTVVGEYSIIKSLNLKQRVIYTTPIKALSNQKYREFQEEFGDVGLITGDVTINPTAGCLIMTTEILRNMLYRGSEIIREVSWVIFDEIHYMRDKERGVVWEETLILLPDNVHFVFLSATIPNARQFAEWVAHLHHQPCHVVYTDYRPTPLQHYIFPIGGDSLHLVIDEKGAFNERNFDIVMKLISNVGKVKKTENKQWMGRNNEGKETACLKIVRMVMEKNLAPAIIFSFSKKECEIYAMQISKLDFNTSDEKKLVDEIFENAMDVLSDEDRSLPQVENVLPLLRRGIGIHHGGLLPILKETIEVLFSEGLIKALFATETFAMGLNMPARTVIFTSIKKYDGSQNRFLTSGEYIQMSGRAGRRGLDDKGTVIVMFDEPLSPANAKDLLQGKADALNSAFHLSYNMILNLIRVDDINPEYLLDKSFFQFQNHAKIPKLREEYDELEKKIAQIKIADEKKISSFKKLTVEQDELMKEYLTFVHKPDNLKQFLRPGRLVKVKTIGDKELGWAMLLNYKHASSPKDNPAKDASTINIDVLIMIDQKSTAKNPEKCLPGITGQMVIITMPHTNILQLSSVCVVLPRDLRVEDNMTTAKMAYKEVEERFKGEFPLLDPLKMIRNSIPRIAVIEEQLASLEQRIKDHNAKEFEDLDKRLETLHEKDRLIAERNNLEVEIDKSLSLLQMDELKCRKRVLRRLEFCTESDVITLKGRVACEISSADELLLTELLFSGVFNDLTPQQATSLLSCFVCEEKGPGTTKMAEELMKPLRLGKDIAKRIANIFLEAKMDVDRDSYLDQMKPFLMDAVLAWCNGVTFLEICKMTDVFEGNIIRCLRLLEELLRQLIQAAKTLGNQDLEAKFNEGIKHIKRDIVFAASLYL